MLHRLVVVVIGLALFLSPVALRAQDDCTADIRGTVKRKEAGDTHTKYAVRIDVAAPLKCAEVRFDVVVVAEDAAGEKSEVRIPKRVRIPDSRTVAKRFDYKLKKGQSVADFRIVQTSCQNCE